MSSQIVYAVRCYANGALPVNSILESFEQPSVLGGFGVPRDDDFLGFWGLRESSDITNTLTDGITISRVITILMGPSSTATATVQLDSGSVPTGITVTGQGEDYVRPPIPV